jgi:hypothetical protein
MNTTRIGCKNQYMLHIEDKSNNTGFTDLKVDGVLNASSLPTLKKIIEKKLSAKKKIRLRLAGIIHCDRNGIYFLRQYQNRVDLDGLSEFLRMEMCAKNINADNTGNADNNRLGEK